VSNSESSGLDRIGTETCPWPRVTIQTTRQGINLPEVTGPSTSIVDVDVGTRRQRHDGELEVVESDLSKSMRTKARLADPKPRSARRISSIVLAAS
jgi:hypothetical protein